MYDLGSMLVLHKMSEFTQLHTLNQNKRTNLS